MPKHYGKTIKLQHYIPLLDDRNISDQGIDANGATMDPTTFHVTFPRLVLAVANASAAAAETTLEDNTSGMTVVAGDADSAGTGFTTLTLSSTVAIYGDATKAAAVEALAVGANSTAQYGNLYGSSRDAGKINSKIPALTETGGRVNRVGFKRITREGSIVKMGMFHEFTQESFDFDSDSELYGHLSRELVTGATQLMEAVLQWDLLHAAGVTLYAGAAATDAEVTAEGGTPSVIDYDDFLRLAQILFDNRTDKVTKIIAGSRMVDTKTINSGWIMYIGSELESTVKKLVDPFGDKAFVPVNQYADAGQIINGEIGM